MSSGGAATPNGLDRTMPVASFAPNGRALYDMSGNVWRFLQDPWLGSYVEAAGEVLTDAPATARRVVRGGSWGSQRRESSSAVSGQSSAVRCAGDGGFPMRLVGGRVP